MAVFAHNLTHRFQWGQPRAFVALSHYGAFISRGIGKHKLALGRLPALSWAVIGRSLSPHLSSIICHLSFVICHFSCVVYFANRVGDGAKALGISTEDLIRRFQRGQPRAFEALYDRFKDYVYRTALFVTRNSGDAEEAVQETFLDVLRALPNYRVEGPARFETWLYRVTVNRCRSRMRRKTLPSADWDDIEDRLERIPEPHPNHDPETVTLRRERAVELWQAADELPEKQRLVVLLRYQQGFAYGEIAQTLGISEGTVKSRLYHAHRKLKERLQSPEAGV